MYDEPVMTQCLTEDKVIEDEPTLVYWLIVNGSSMAHRGILSLYDGLSTQGEMIARVETYGACVPVFYPPIRCKHGVYIAINDRVSYYTIGYLRERDAYNKK